LIKDIYDDVPLSEIPWNCDDPPEQLVELYESGRIPNGAVLDVGCGAGNYSIYLARKGFSVTGIDRSPGAIRYAKNQASAARVQCNFLVIDVEKEFDKVEGLFDFIFDWQLLHHIFPKNRRNYVDNIFRLLKPNGRYLSVCFHENDSQFGGNGKYRETSLGSILYFSSEVELRELFSSLFDILDFKIFKCGVSSSHIVNYVFMRKN
jgi:SAM-dependent methyltransferase